MSAQHESYVVTLRAMPGDSRPPVTRLRQLLKIARRALRLQCVAVQEVVAKDSVGVTNAPG